MAANVSTDHGAETTPSGPADAGRVPAVGPSTLRRVTVVVGFILLPLGAIILASAPLLHASGWTGAALVAGRSGGADGRYRPGGRGCARRAPQVAPRCRPHWTEPRSRRERLIPGQTIGSGRRCQRRSGLPGDAIPRRVTQVERGIEAAPYGPGLGHRMNRPSHCGLRSAHEHGVEGHASWWRKPSSQSGRRSPDPG